MELMNGHYMQAGIDEMTAFVELFTWESAVKYKIPTYNSAIPTAEKAIVTKGTQYARAAGIAGEEAVGISGPKEAIEVGDKIRIPDRLTKTTLEEVKNVKSLSFTRQLRDFSNFAQQKGLRFILYTRPDTKLSGPLQQAIKNGLIFQRFIPGL